MSLDSFPVICETCNARLRVKDPAARGQIRACPKCGSMVHLVPPASLALGDLAEAESTPLPTTSAAKPDFAPLLDPLSVDESTRPIFESSGVEKSGLAKPPQDAVTENVATQTAENGVPQTAPGIMRWGTHKVPLLWVSLAGAGLLLIGGVAGGVWMQVGHEDSSVASLAGPAVQEAQAVPEPGPPSVSYAQSDVATDALPDQPTDLGLTAQTTSRSASTTVPAEAPAAELVKPSPGETRSGNLVRNDSGLSVEASPVVADRGPPTQDKTDAAVASASEAEATESTTTQSVDILALDPAALELAPGLAGDSVGGGVAAGEAKHPVASFEPIPKQPVPPDQPPSIGASDPLVDNQGTAIQPPVPPAGQNSLPDRGTDGLEAMAAVRRGPVDRQPGHAHDISAQLAIPIASMELSAIPLEGWLTLVSDLMAVPITLDPNGLLVAGLAADEPITVSSGDTTGGELLERVLAEHRLHFVEKSGQLLVMSQERERPRTSNYEVKELLPPGTADATPIAAWVRHLVEPNSWSSQVGTGDIQVVGSTLEVEHRQGVQVQVLVLLERMLLARDRPNKSRYPTDLLSIEPTYLLLQPKLQQARAVNFLPWAELREVLHYVQQAWGVTVLVDWQSLADVQLEPTSLVACSVGAGSWDEFFDQVFKPLELAWRPLDEGTIQITSQATAQTARWIEFYPVANLVGDRFSDSDSLVEAITGDLSEAELAECEFVYDLGSEHLLVLANGAAHHVLTAKLAAL